MWGDRSYEEEEDQLKGQRWQAQAGEFLGDSHNVPGVILCALGIVAVACALTAAGYGYEGWAIMSAIIAVALWLAGLAVLTMEHRRHGRMEVEHDRLGHPPVARQSGRYNATQARYRQNWQSYR
ncbi:hypothetical protein AB0H76_17080 [Nocardia sp. NPDC050712]|uniref:hypothetical protein n=1 Tax=Nocardia sp. NPDC050712 TaxID=3155518 RepID=UPI0034037192